MASAKATLDLPVSPDDVWQLIGGFGSLPDWVTGVFQSQLVDGGRVRHLHDSSGHTFVERLESYDRAGRRYSYSILQSPVSVTGYLAIISVTPDNGDGSHIEWSATFTSINMSQDEASSIFRSIFSSGLTALARHFSSGTQE
jgi:Polyketide cyclase / dehydrase and lipid transport